MMKGLVFVCIFLIFDFGKSLQVTSNPPLIDVPTYSLATIDENGKTGMNILTYATPVSVRPDRIWSIGLFKGTVAHANFARNGKGVLQLLSPCHANVVRLLGGSSGKDIDKKLECEKLRVLWVSPMMDDMPELLPDCAYYLKVRRVGEMIDCGSHDVALCKIESMLVADEKNELNQEYLNTAKLRELGIITEQGRIKE
eukprot:scaffold8922_cov287-Chaetoceros_neogracile.AAC.6